MPESSAGTEAAAAPSCGSLSFWSRCWPWLAAILSGILLSLCFPRWNQTWLCCFALVPLICALWFDPAGAKPRRKAAMGYVSGAAFFLSAFSWLITVHVVGWIAISLYLSLFFGFWGWFAGSLFKEREFLHSSRNIGIALLCSAAWVAQEWVRGWLFSGFGWNGLGVALYKQLPLIQIAEYTGVAGLSFLVILWNLILVITVRRFISEIARKKIRPHLDFSFTMVLAAIVFAFGLHRTIKVPATRQVRVEAIQANVPQNQKMDERFAEEIGHRYDLLTRAALAEKPELLLWPEACVPGGMFASKEADAFVRHYVEDNDTNFLLGTDDFDDSNDYNAAVLLTDKGANAQIYHKIHLVPFGEFIPFRHSFPLFAWIAGDLVPDDFKAGTEFTLLETTKPPMRIAPLICFEDTLGDLTRQFVRKGADVLVNLTNDGWFLHSAAAEQHLANAVFRSVETRRPLARVANTGITCFINSQGKMTGAVYDPKTGNPFIQKNLRGVLEIPEQPVTTFYVRFGELFAQLCAATTAIAILVHLRQKTRPSA